MVEYPRRVCLTVCCDCSWTVGKWYDPATVGLRRLAYYRLRCELHMARNPSHTTGVGFRG